jgi:hypothetical protein
MSYDALLINFAKVVQVTTPDGWMEPLKTVGDPQPCRIMWRNRLVKDFKGEEVLSIAKIFFKKDATFGHEDQLQLDVEAYAINHPIVDVNKPQNSVAHHHTEVFIS